MFNLIYNIFNFSVFTIYEKNINLQYTPNVMIKITNSSKLSTLSFSMNTTILPLNQHWISCSHICLIWLNILWHSWDPSRTHIRLFGLTTWSMVYKRYRIKQHSFSYYWLRILFLIIIFTVIKLRVVICLGYHALGVVKLSIVLGCLVVALDLLI